MILFKVAHFIQVAKSIFQTIFEIMNLDFEIMFSRTVKKIIGLEAAGSLLK